jgi:hypothetical protein
MRDSNQMPNEPKKGISDEFSEIKIDQRALGGNTLEFSLCKPS